MNSKNCCLPYVPSIPKECTSKDGAALYFRSTAIDIHKYNQQGLLAAPIEKQREREPGRISILDKWPISLGDHKSNALPGRRSMPVTNIERERYIGECK